MATAAPTTSCDKTTWRRDVMHRPGQRCPGPRAACASTTGGAAATVVALILTLLGLARRTDREFGLEIYLQLRWISLVAVITVMLTVITLFVMSVPVDGSELSDRWIPTLYHTCGALLSIVTGLMIALMTMLLLTTSDVLAKLNPGESV